MLELLAVNNQDFLELKSRIEVMPDLTKEEIDQSYSWIGEHMKQPESEVDSL